MFDAMVGAMVDSSASVEKQGTANALLKILGAPGLLRYACHRKCKKVSLNLFFDSRESYVYTILYRNQINVNIT